MESFAWAVSDSSQILFAAALFDDVAAEVVSGTAVLSIGHIKTDGTIESYDFNDNTFKTTALTTATLALTYRTMNNATQDSGIWTALLATLTAFSVGSEYFFRVLHTGATPNANKGWFAFRGRPSNLQAIAGTAAGAIQLDRSARGIGSGTVTAGSSTTSIVTSTCTPAGAAVNQFAGRVMIFDNTTTTAALRGQAQAISASTNAAAPTFTTAAFTTAPATGDTFAIV